MPHQCAVAEDGISGASGAGQAPFELECRPNGEYGRHARDWRLIGFKHRVDLYRPRRSGRSAGAGDDVDALVFACVRPWRLTRSTLSSVGY